MSKKQRGPSPAHSPESVLPAGTGKGVLKPKAKRTMTAKQVEALKKYQYKKGEPSANPRGSAIIHDPRKRAAAEFLATLDLVDKRSGLKYKVLMMERICRNDALLAQFLDKLLPALPPELVQNFQQNILGATSTPGAPHPTVQFLEQIVLNRAARVGASPARVIEAPPVNGTNGNGHAEEPETPVTKEGA